MGAMPTNLSEEHLKAAMKTYAEQYNNALQNSYGVIFEEQALPRISSLDEIVKGVISRMEV